MLSAISFLEYNKVVFYEAKCNIYVVTIVKELLYSMFSIRWRCTQNKMGDLKYYQLNLKKFNIIMKIQEMRIKDMKYGEIKMHQYSSAQNGYCTEAV